MSKPVCLIVCTGKDCRGDKGYRQLVDMAAACEHSLQAPCQGLCDGPIVAIKNGDEVRWFSHAGSKSIRKMLAKALHTGHAKKDLRKLEVRKRRDTLRGAGRVKPLTGKHLRSAA